jgi:lysophospholipase L1-like esterase
VDSELHTVTPEENARRVRFNQLVDEVVAASGGRASTVDFAGVVCDFRQPCPRSVGGVELRPLDGGHFEDEGAAVVAARLAPLLAAVDLGPQV